MMCVELEVVFSIFIFAIFLKAYNFEKTCHTKEMSISTGSEHQLARLAIIRFSKNAYFQFKFAEI